MHASCLCCGRKRGDVRMGCGHCDVSSNGFFFFTNSSVVEPYMFRSAFKWVTVVLHRSMHLFLWSAHNRNSLVIDFGPRAEIVYQILQHYDWAGQKCLPMPRANIDGVSRHMVITKMVLKSVEEIFQELLSVRGLSMQSFLMAIVPLTTRLSDFS